MLYIYFITIRYRVAPILQNTTDMPYKVAHI